MESLIHYDNNIIFSAAYCQEYYPSTLENYFILVKNINGEWFGFCIDNTNAYQWSEGKHSNKKSLTF